MRKRICLLVVSSCLPLFFGCTAQPRVEVDLTGLGFSQIGKIIEKNFGNSPDDVKKKLNNLINDPKISSASDKKAALEGIGLHCEVAPICTYHGTAKSKLISPDGNVLPKNNILDTYDITADYSGQIIKSTIYIVSKDNQN